MVDSHLCKTPLTTFVIDEEDTSAFDIPQLTREKSRFRERPKHSSQTDFTEFLKKRDEEEKESHFDAQITFILNSFAKQYTREYIKMKIKNSVYDTIDKELNRKSFTSVPQYYHLRKSKKHTKQSQGFQPVYSLRIASSRTEIGADKNEYTAYIIVGSRISPFDSKITVCVKRFTELRTFASEIVRRLHKSGKDLALANNIEFPYHTRLFGTIDKKQLEKRRNAINTYLESICGDENVVRHSYFLSFFDFNDGQYSDYNEHKINDNYKEAQFRLKCIEETLEIIGMNGGIPIDSADITSDDMEDILIPIPPDKEHNYKEQELNFEVPYDLHHYKDPEYKLVAAIFDIIQQQLEMKEQSDLDDNGSKAPFHVSTNSNFMNSYHASMHALNAQKHQQAKPQPPPQPQPRLPNGDDSHINANANTHKKHSRKHSGGVVLPSPLPPTHLRAMSIIESSFTPATMIFHPSISAKSGKIESNIDSNNYIDLQNENKWTSNQFKSKFNSSIRGIDGGPRIIRTASEATSDQSLSYKIPTLVSQVWSKISILLDAKKESIPLLLAAVNKDLYPIIQEAMNDVAPIIKSLYNSQSHNHQNQSMLTEYTLKEKAEENTQSQSQNPQKHGKYLSMFGHGYDGDEDSSSDSDGSEIRRSIGIRHFPFISAMRQYCISESRLYEFFLAFENLAIDNIFGHLDVDSDANENNKYKYIHLLSYNYNILSNTSSINFTDRLQHIERIHNQINLILCEIIYAVLKCMMKCLGDIILYKDLLEETFIACGDTFDQDVINKHEDSLLNILRDSGYNISFIVDDLKQKIKSQFKEYSSVIFNPLLDGISTIGEISLNCICLMISQFVFDDGQFPLNINTFRSSFIQIWFQPLDYYISDVTECVFYILYQSSIGLVHSASQDLLQNNIFNYASSSNSHSTSTWYQILRGQNIKNISRKIPPILNKNISTKDILDLVIERTLTNIVDETLIYIKLECEKAFFLKFQKKEQRLFNYDF